MNPPCLPGDCSFAFTRPCFSNALQLSPRGPTCDADGPAAPCHCQLWYWPVGHRCCKGLRAGRALHGLRKPKAPRGVRGSASRGRGRVTSPGTQRGHQE